jgi:hypothetical protein
MAERMRDYGIEVKRIKKRLDTLGNDLADFLVLAVR